MAYLLVFPLSFYIALAVIVWQRQPRSPFSYTFVAYLALVSLATSGYLILGTTGSETVAKPAAIGPILFSSWIYLVLFPLALLGLYFESWFRARWRYLLSLSSSVLVGVNLIMISVIATSDTPIVGPLETGFELHWILSNTTSSWSLTALLVMLSQVMVAVTLAVALKHQRAPFWRGAMLITLASLSSVLIPLLSPVVGARFLNLVAGLGFLPPVLALAVTLWQNSPGISLETLIQSVTLSHNEGMIITDGRLRVLWHNAQAAHWLGIKPAKGYTPPTPIRDLLRGSPLLATVERLIAQPEAQSEAEVPLGSEEHIILLEWQPLDNVRNLPGAHLMRLRDVTAARIRQDLDERRRELLAFNAISTDIASSLEMRQIIDRALQQVLAITGAAETVVYLVDQRHPDQLALAGNLIEKSDCGDAPPTLPLEGSTVGDVVRSLQPVITPDASKDSSQATRMAICSFQAAATIPLIARARALGALQIGWLEPRALDTIEITMLESIGRQLAIALDNARLHDQERRQRRVAEVLREVASILASKSRDDALQDMLRLLAEVLPYDRATVMLLAEPGQLRVRAHAGQADADSGTLIGAHVTISEYPYLAALFADHSRQIVTDTTADNTWVPGKVSQFGSWMGVPLIIRGQVLGCLSISHKEPGHFDQQDLELASAFADQAVIAVENAQLFNSEQRRRAQAEQMQQISYNLVTRATLDDALDAALTSLATMLSFDRAHIALIDEESSTWLPRAGRGYSPVWQDHLARPTPLSRYPLVQRMLAERRALWVRDTREEALWRPSETAVNEVRCWVGAPLIARERMIGVLNIDCFAPHSLSAEEFQIAQTFANQIAAAIENFRLLEEAGDQNRALSALNSVLAASNEALTHENLLTVALERVLEVLGLSEGAIHQRGTDHVLRLRAAAGLPDAVVEQIRSMPVTNALPPVNLNGHGTRSFFSVPLVSHGTEIGLLSISQSPDKPLSRELQQLLGSIGHQLGVVVHNATLFEDTTRRGEISTDMGRFSLAISARLDRAAVLDLICRESIGVIGAHGAYIWLIEQDRLVAAAAHGPGADRFRGFTYDLKQRDLLPAQVIHTWKPQYINHAAATTLLPPEFLLLSQAQAAIAVPLLKADIPIGTLVLTNTENPDAFADWLLEHVGLLGVQAALAIQNATLFDEIRRRLDQLRLVNEVGRYTSAILNPENLIEGVAKKLFEVLHYDIIGFMLTQDGQLTVHSIFVQPPGINNDEVRAYYLTSESAAGQAVMRAEPVLANHTCEQRTGPSHVPESVACCALAVPLVAADEVIGALVVERKGVDSVGQEDLDVMEPLATQIAISVQNAYLFERIRQHTIELEARVSERTAEIRQQHERTEAILRSVADAVIVFNLGGQIVMTNPVARDLFDQHDLDMDLSQRIGDLFERTLRAEDDGDMTEEIEVGAVTLQAKSAPVLAGAGEVLGVVVVLRDISHFRELDRMKDLFVSNVSHELRTPLANLKLYLSLLEHGRPDRRANYMEVMKREVERLERLISDLLDLSRLQQTAHRPQIREPVDIEATINRVIQDNVAWAESKQETLHHECLSSPLPGVVGNADQLVRALTNLVGNAINYTHAGGCVTVRSQVGPDKHANPESVIIEVIDTGIGIPAAEIPLIFDRFYRGSNVDPNIPGTGLGLAIIRDIIELHGGSISVDSQEGKGSTFRLELPVRASTPKHDLSETDG